MKYLPIAQGLFVRNRRRFVKQLKPSSVAVFHSNDVMPTNADGTLPFRQSSDLFYLSGIDQEESILMLFPDAKDERMREVLFVRETNDQILTWEGYKLTKEQAREVSGIGSILWTHQFEQVLGSQLFEAEHIYLNTNEHLRAVVEVETRDARFIKKVKELYPLHKYERSAPILHQLRAVKSEQEVALIQQACDITEKAFRRLLGFISPGVMEYEIEAELYHEFLRNRSRGPAYAPIIASGGNACILHYTDNNQECEEGELVLMDFGAEYANYAADLTRTVPVSGKFTPRQREVYNSVLAVMKAATQMLVPGNTLGQYHKFVGTVMENELIRLGLLNEQDIRHQDPVNPLYKRYFMHGTSHHLGLDVHDVGNRFRPFEAGMVFTCEPGIYIREEGIGIRLEDDILITPQGPKNLMQHIPIEADAIERLMQQ
ncbi:aminopeptidase P N-terminal domain-containing protein [Pontibacter sp. E15-1]|uniref:aminopeptidase P N-terminal domain-containing protein n=1 Tax=Pontibacter sp. E15-1 TaxID=2919918 RepID=UPI001F4FE192|nr:aminopeptidase P N-terminal domain-containing protein [Pontibacter sp. E15-1]MCJ8165138.1 aminopeptidase P N-terminal domain-containing protein [Pontibacter sp. E15-1]